MTYIYKITNKINNHIYIGKTVNSIEDRWKDHVYSALSGDKDSGCPLHLAIRKYSKENFLVELVEQCDDNDAAAREKYWIAFFDSYYNGYNATLGGDGCPLYDREYIKQLWEQGMSNQEICKILGCDKGTVRKALYSLGYSKEELLQRRAEKAKLHIDLNQLKDLWEEELTVTEISKIMHETDRKISESLELLGIDSIQRHNRYYDSLLRVHWSEIIRLYKEGKSCSTIRKITGCSLNSIKRTIERHLD